MIELPAHILSDWSGRFRFRRLVVDLARSESVDSPTAIDAVLDGLIAGQDELAVFDQLLSDGEFRLTETMLDECQVLLTRGADELRIRIDRARASRLQFLASHLQKFADMADTAGLSVELDHRSLEERCQQSWPEVAAVLKREGAALAQLIAHRTAELCTRMDTSERINSGTAEICRTLLESGHLRAAEQLLDSSGGDIPLGPESMPRLRPWIWTMPPNEILQWHADAIQHRPPDFAGWIPEAVDARMLLNSFHDLSNGVSKAAHDVAVALNRFLGADLDPAEVHSVQGGSLARLHNLFQHPPTGRFHPTGTVALFIADPGTTQIPADLASMEPFVAVGPSLVEQTRRARREAAVLSVRDLLRLVLQSRHRSVSLLRLLGPQWPLSALSAGSADQLAQLLEPDYESRWRTLSWLVYLTGLGDAATTDAIAFQTGLDAKLIDLLLNHLVQIQEQQPNHLLSEATRRWMHETHMLAVVEPAVLDPIRHSPHAVLAFWAALSVAPPGQPVSLDEIALAVEMCTDATISEPDLRSGLAELDSMWLVLNESVNTFAFRRCGVLIAFRAEAESRLADASRIVVEHFAESARPTMELTTWDHHKHALSPTRQQYLHLLDDPATDTATVTAAWETMVWQTANVLESNPVVTGRTDVVAILHAMQHDFTDSHDGMDLLMEAPRAAVAAVSRELVEVLIHELVHNAAEALSDAGEGTVSVSLKVSHGDVIVDVRDSGPGIDIETDATYRLFRPGVSTRGPGRGRGLYVARRLTQLAGGELDLVVTPHNHPILRGAHFRLILPSV